MLFFPGLVAVIDVTAFRMSQRISGLFGIGTSCVKYPIWNVYSHNGQTPGTLCSGNLTVFILPGS